MRRILNQSPQVGFSGQTLEMFVWVEKKQRFKDELFSVQRSYVCVCVCLCKRERERESTRLAIEV